MQGERESDRIAIITYHSIDDSGSVISVSRSNFKKQIVFLKRRGYRTVPLSEVVSILAENGAFPEKSLGISFDDGYRNNFLHAVPILKGNDFTATVFLTTGWCERENSWLDQHPSIPVLPMLSWEEVDLMRDNGIEFGAHTRNHLRLTHLKRKEAVKEILESKADIEDRLFRPVELFSYPYGDYDQAIKEIVKTSFRGAISNRPGKVTLRSDRYALERINAAGRIFRAVPLQIHFLTSFSLYLSLKKMVDGLKASKGTG